MEVYFATGNSGKVNSLQRDLNEYGISVVWEKIDLIEPRSSDVKEIAAAKINQAYPLIGKPTVVVDAGFYIPSLKGFPRAFANFALETIGLEGILRLVEGKDRGCEFTDCLAYRDGNLAEPIYFMSGIRGSVSYIISEGAQKNAWSELWNIFVPEGCTKTLADMTGEELSVWRERVKGKNTLGHQLGRWLTEHAV